MGAFNFDGFRWRRPLLQGCGDYLRQPRGSDLRDLVYLVQTAEHATQLGTTGQAALSDRRTDVALPWEFDLRRELIGGSNLVQVPQCLRGLPSGGQATRLVGCTTFSLHGPVSLPVIARELAWTLIQRAVLR